MKCLMKALAIVLVCVFCFSSCSSNGNSVFKTPTIINKTVKFETNGGTAVAAKQTDIVSNPPNTSKTNCLFDGWYLDEDFNYIAVFPLTVDKDMTLYAKWIELTKTQGFAPASLSLKSGWETTVWYDVTPTGFDWERLTEEGYRITITVSYDFYYEKAYDVLWDVGYMGAPKYEISIVNGQGWGTIKEDLLTTTKKQKGSATYRTTLEEAQRDSIKLMFHTNNIQNIIHFSNIVATYQCVKA